jgi:hypothetical protein
LIPEDLIASELRLMSPFTLDEDPGSSLPGQPEAELIKHLIGGPDLTLVEHSHAPFRTGPCAAAILTRDGYTWWCTRVAGHAGEHIAGTGRYVAFVWVGGDTRW